MHRGPDQEYFFHQQPFSITFNRLSITGGLDGAQPINSLNGRWSCFLNGEIYNFKELKAKITPSTIQSDTRVLVEGIARFGLSFLNEISGMYAIVLHDKLENRLFLCRDPLGEKPLFYSKLANKIEISSEVMPILKRSLRNLDLNQGAITDYFRFGYIEEPWTVDRQIFAFERGFIYEIDSQMNLTKTSTRVGNREIFPGELEELIELLNKQVVPSDIGQAVLLSGGIDSASMIRNLDSNQRENSIAITLDTGGDINKLEISSAKKSARKFGLRHSVVQYNLRNLTADLERVALAFDQPHSDMASLGYFKLFEIVKKQSIKVAVLGHGPDEIFWGYDWFNRLFRSINFKEESRVFWNTPANLSHLLERNSSSNGKQPLAESDPYLHSSSAFQRARAEIVHSYLTHNGLRQSDRLAMHFSVEPRTPYADYRLYLWAQENSNTEYDLSKEGFKKAISRNPLNRLRRRAKQGFDIGMMKFLNSENFEKEFKLIRSDLLKRDIHWRVDFASCTFNSREKYRLAMLEYWLRQHG